MKLPIALMLQTLSACSDDGVATSLEGIYVASEWTEKESSCDSEGASVLAAQSSDHVLVQVVDFFGVEFIQASLCTLDSCREDLGSNVIQLGNSFAFESGSDADGWEGSGHAISGSGSCSGEVWTDTLTTGSEGNITIERRAIRVEDVPLDSEGFCDGDAAEEMAKSLPCSRLEVIHASYQEG